MFPPLPTFSRRAGAGAQVPVLFKRSSLLWCSLSYERDFVPGVEPYHTTYADSLSNLDTFLNVSSPLMFKVIQKTAPSDRQKKVKARGG